VYERIIFQDSKETIPSAEMIRIRLLFEMNQTKVLSIFY
jgi:hypothetical protein